MTIVSGSGRLNGSVTYPVGSDQSGSKTVEDDGGELEGEIQAGDTITLRGEDWDPAGANIDLLVDGAVVGSLAPSADFETEVMLPQFTPRRADDEDRCTVEIVARQTGYEAKLIVRGQYAGRVAAADDAEHLDGSNAEVDDAVCEGSEPRARVGGALVLVGEYENPQTDESQRSPDWGAFWVDATGPDGRLFAPGGVLVQQLIIARSGGAPIIVRANISGGSLGLGGTDASELEISYEHLFSGAGVPVIVPTSSGPVSWGRLDNGVVGYIENIQFLRDGGLGATDCRGAGFLNAVPIITRQPRPSSPFAINPTPPFQLLTNTNLYIAGDIELLGCPGRGALFGGTIEAPVLVVGMRPDFARVAADSEAGADRVETESNEGFEPGDQVIVNPGGSNQEQATVDRKGSLIFRSPLQFAHFAGEVVMKVPPFPSEFPLVEPGAPAGGPTPTPTAPPSPGFVVLPATAPSVTPTPAPATVPPPVEATEVPISGLPSAPLAVTGSSSRWLVMVGGALTSAGFLVLGASRCARRRPS